MPTSWIVTLVMAAALAGAGLMLNGQIKANGELKQSLKETSAALERVAGVVKEQEAEKQRLSIILAEREAVVHENSKQAAAHKEAVRVVVQQSPDIRRCSDVYWPADVVQRLRDGSGQRGGGGQGKAAAAPAN